MFRDGEQELHILIDNKGNDAERGKDSFGMKTLGCQISGLEDQVGNLNRQSAYVLL